MQQINQTCVDVHLNSFSPADVLIERHIFQSQRQHGFPAEHEIRKVKGCREDAHVGGQRPEEDKQINSK